MNSLQNYFASYPQRFSYLTLIARIIIATISIILYLKLSQAELSNQGRQYSLNFLITGTAIFISVFSIFADHSFPACIISIFVLAILLRVTNQIHRDNN